MKRILLVSLPFILYFTPKPNYSPGILKISQSKSQVEIADIAQTVRDYDIIAIK
jgi:hypothetical protein